MTTYGADWSKHPYYKEDPLHEIAPALLNSYDITRYVDKGCLLEKDLFDPERLKPASYEMKFLGTLYRWELKDGKLERQCHEIVEGKTVELSRNSISYLWIQECLRLPEYIAARFNLRIRDVHKGILLGTGPLIDPGFGGRILIPLHNLTDNDYCLLGGEGIIWVEFTKVSMHDCWLPDPQKRERPSGLVEFPSRKAIDDPDVYLYKAHAGLGVQSAFRGALDNATQAADAARVDAEKATKRADVIEKGVRTLGYGGVLAVALGVAALLLTAFLLLFSVYDFRGRVTDTIHGQDRRLLELERVLGEMSADPNTSSAGEEPAIPEASDLDVEEAVPSQNGMARD